MGLRWYIDGSLTLQISLGNHWLVGLRWYTLVGANPKVLAKIFNNDSAQSVLTSSFLHHHNPAAQQQQQWAHLARMDDRTAAIKVDL